MECSVSSSFDSRAWDGLVSSDDQASFFQTPLWSDVLVRTLDGHELLFAAGRIGERLVAGLPAVRRRRGPVSILESMPFGTHGGMLASPEAPEGAAAELVSALIEAAGGATLGRVHMVDYGGRLGVACEAFQAIEGEAQVVRLDRPYDEVQAGFRPSARNKIRKAENAGVTVREAVGTDDFLAYHGLLEECSERWGAANPFGEAFFAALAESGSDTVQMWLAEHEGAIIAGDLNFLSGSAVFNWGNVSHRDSVGLAPNSLLHAHGMRDGCRRGLVSYNLGSSGGIDAVARFKSAFGTERVPYREYVLEKVWMRLGNRLRGHGGGDTT